MVTPAARRDQVRRVARREVRQLRHTLGRVKRRVQGRHKERPSIDAWATDPSERLKLLESARTDMEREFYRHEGLPLHKWTHYLAAYERHLGHLRGSSFGLLEIGVDRGGSLQLWRRYFGDEARLMGIDINPACADVAEPPTIVRIGSQDDPEFLKACAAEIGQLDVVIDDGSHCGEHQWASFQTLFPVLAENGIYVIEDLHAAYWFGYQDRPAGHWSGIGLVHTLIDDMHSWYHDRGDLTGAGRWVPALHVYDSMVVIEKVRREAPRHMVVGAQVDVE